MVACVGCRTCHIQAYPLIVLCFDEIPILVENTEQRIEELTAATHDEKRIHFQHYQVVPSIEPQPDCVHNSGRNLKTLDIIHLLIC